MTQYAYNGDLIDIHVALTLGENQYPPGWFSDQESRVAAGIVDVADVAVPAVESGNIAFIDGIVETDGLWYVSWAVRELSPEEIAVSADALDALKIAKNNQINQWHFDANQSFQFDGKVFSHDPISSDNITGVGLNIALLGVFPVGFPGSWKAIDNSTCQMSTIQKFKDFFAAMTACGASNFIHSEELKAALGQATTPHQVNEIVW